LEAETIFIAEVICFVELTDAILILTSFNPGMNIKLN
jgi:hypothetical protein